MAVQWESAVVYAYSFNARVRMYKRDIQASILVFDGGVGHIAQRRVASK